MPLKGTVGLADNAYEFKPTQADMKALSIFFCWLLLAGNLHASFYQASLSQSHWEVSQSKIACRLTHEIPHYGRAEFIQSAGESLVLGLQADHLRAPITQAGLSVRAPAWMHGFLARQIHPVYLQEERASKFIKLIVAGETAEQMLDELGRGRFPTFTYEQALGVRNEEIRVAVSAVNFLASYEAFLACRRQLLPYGYRKIQDQTLFFNLASRALSLKAQQKIERIAHYLKFAEDYSVMVSSETADFDSKAEQKWFTARFAAIKARFVQEGIDSRRILARRTLWNGGNEGERMIRLRLLGPEALRTYHYASTQVSLDGLDRRRLDLLARYTMDYFRNGKLIINGHADGWGPSQDNQALSERRALAIKNYLEAKGVPAEQLIIRAHGEMKPLFRNRSLEGRARNRRVQIDLLMPGLSD